MEKNRNGEGGKGNEYLGLVYLVANWISFSEWSVHSSIVSRARAESARPDI